MSYTPEDERLKGQHRAFVSAADDLLSLVHARLRSHGWNDAHRAELKVARDTIQKAVDAVHEAFGDA